MSFMLKKADEREAKIQALEIQKELLLDTVEAKNEAIAKRDAVIHNMYAVMKRMATMIPDREETATAQ